MVCIVAIPPPEVKKGWREDQETILADFKYRRVHGQIVLVVFDGEVIEVDSTEKRRYKSEKGK